MAKHTTKADAKTVPQDNPEFWKISALAKRWGMHVRTLVRMVERGDLHAVKIARMYRITDAERARIERSGSAPTA